MPYINHEFTRFAVVGGINTFTYYAIYLGCLHLLHLNYFLSHIIGFLVSMVGSFFLNAYFTYKIKPTLVKFLQFPLTQLANTLLTAMLLFLFVGIFHLNSSFAPIAVVFFTVPITFMMTRRVMKPS
ncbi:GtrA family protein [Niallia sp. 03133]|uniref:GtrA family protein n=1 Tax=Niallia sp. 03133 TaxID=3458060 RepID=UPI004043F420